MKHSIWLRIIIVVFVSIIMVGAGLIIFATKTEAPKPTAVPCVNLGTVCYELESATTNEARIKGLSDREKLSEKAGMLFVFDSSDQQCMWMKDMKISNDMIWLDDAKRVIKIEQKVAPDSYPKTYCSESPARYVIELNGGQVQKNQLQIGDIITF